MKKLIHDSCGEKRTILCDEDGPCEIQIIRDISLNLNDIVEAKISAFHPVLHGYFATTERGDVFLPVSDKFCEGNVIRVKITKEARGDKVATAHPCEGETAETEAEGIPVSETEMDEYITEALCPDISLIGGGELHIEQSKVCWTIDVDSGKDTQDLDKLNQSAIEMIVRQIKLKNMGGLILIDFAGSKRTPTRVVLEKNMKKQLEQDKLIRICGWTRAGLFELERKRTRADLWATCNENNPVAVYYRILRALNKSRLGKPIAYVAPVILALLQKKGIKAEPLFDKPVSYFEIREK